MINIALSIKQLRKSARQIIDISGKAIRLLSSIYCLKSRGVANAFAGKKLSGLIAVASVCFLLITPITLALYSMQGVRINPIQGIWGIFVSTLGMIIEVWPIAAVYWLFSGRSVRIVNNLILTTVIFLCILPYNVFSETLLSRFGFPLVKNMEYWGIKGYLVESAKLGIPFSLLVFSWVISFVGLAWQAAAIFKCLGDLNKMSWQKSLLSFSIAVPITLIWVLLVNGVDPTRFFTGKPWN